MLFLLLVVLLFACSFTNAQDVAVSFNSNRGRLLFVSPFLNSDSTPTTTPTRPIAFRFVSFCSNLNEKTNKQTNKIESESCLLHNTNTNTNCFEKEAAKKMQFCFSLVESKSNRNRNQHSFQSYSTVKIVEHAKLRRLLVAIVLAKDR